MRTELSSFYIGNILINQISLREGRTELAYLNYFFNSEKKTVYIKWLNVHDKHRGQGHAKELIIKLLEITPDTFSVDPMSFSSTDGRELWKKAKYISNRIIPVTHVEAHNKEFGEAKHVPSTPKYRK